MAFVVDRETYKIVAYLSDNALNVEGGTPKDQTKILAWPVGNANNERWVANVEDGNYFSLTSRAQPVGGVRYCLDASQSALGHVISFTFRNSDNQQWIAEPVSNHSYLVYLKNRKTGTYLQYNGSHQAVSTTHKVENEKQWWSFQEIGTGIRVDSDWLDSLTYPLKTAEDAKKKELVRLERERIERERIERERIERERIERERKQSEVAEKEREMAEREKRIAELERAQKDKIDSEKARAERELALREQKLAEMEKQLALAELAAREKAIKEREIWIIEQERLQRELREKLVIQIQTVSDEEAKRAKAEKERIQIEITERERIEAERREKERLEREADEKAEWVRIKREQELQLLEVTNREEAIRQREILIIERERLAQQAKKVTIHLVRRADGTVERVGGGETTVTTTTTGGSAGGSSNTWRTVSVEETPDERIKREKEVTETVRVVKYTE